MKYFVILIGVICAASFLLSKKNDRKLEKEMLDIISKCSSIRIILNTDASKNTIDAYELRSQILNGNIEICSNTKNFRLIFRILIDDREMVLVGNADFTKIYLFFEDRYFKVNGISRDYVIRKLDLLRAGEGKGG